MLNIQQKQGGVYTKRSLDTFKQTKSKQSNWFIMQMNPSIYKKTPFLQTKYYYKCWATGIIILIIVKIHFMCVCIWSNFLCVNVISVPVTVHTVVCSTVLAICQGTRSITKYEEKPEMLIVQWRYQKPIHISGFRRKKLPKAIVSEATVAKLWQ